MTLRRFSVCCIISVTLVMTGEFSVSAQEPFRLTPAARFFLGMEWGYFWLSGEMLVPAGGRLGSGTRIDVSSDLGVDQGESTSVVLQAAILERHLVNVNYLMCSPSGQKKTPTSFRFQNQTYPTDSRLESRLDFNWIRLSYAYKLKEISSSWLGPSVGVHHIRFGATLNGRTDDGASISNTRRLDGTYPVVGFEARHLFPHGIDLNLQMEGMHLITRGFLAMVRLGASWEIHPDVVISLDATSRLVNWIEDNQELNNEWSFSLAGFSSGVSFGF